MFKTRTSVSLRALVISFGIVVAGCDDDSMPAQDTGADSGGSSESSSDGGSAQMGLRATIDGTVVDFDSPGATLAGLSSTDLAVAGSATNPSRSFSFGLANAVGTVECSTTTGTQMGMNVQGMQTLATTPGGDCTITLTEVAAAVGDDWVGSFSGHLVGNDDLMVTVTEGSFRLPRTQ